MEVTSKNFNEALPLIGASILKSDFLAIDAEFTGLRDTQKERSSCYNYPEKQYSKVLKESSNFLLIQFGLSAFYWDDEAKTYMNETYTLFLYPRSPAEVFFQCQSSSLTVLAANGFDFNKLITEGIGFMTDTQEKIIRQKLNENVNKYQLPSYQKPRHDDEFITKAIENIQKKIKQYLDSNESEPLILDKYIPHVENYIIQNTNASRADVFVEHITLKNDKRFKILRYGHVDLALQAGWSPENQTPRKLTADISCLDSILRVSKVSSVQKRIELINKHIERENKEFEDALGFTKVARMIRDSGILVVGHNLLLDILHTLNSCFAPLPDDYKEFKTLAHKSFPNIIDTKYLSTSSSLADHLNSASLTTLITSLSEPPFLMPKVGAVEGRGCMQTDDNYHDAGFDAFTTGLCFLAMCKYLVRSPDRQLRVDVNLKELHEFHNKLYLARTASKGVPYINLTGSENLPQRNNFFYVTFPAAYRKTLYQYFRAYGYVNVEILGEESAIVELTVKERAPELLRNFKHQHITVMSFEEYTKKK